MAKGTVADKITAAEAVARNLKAVVATNTMTIAAEIIAIVIADAITTDRPARFLPSPRLSLPAVW